MALEKIQKEQLYSVKDFENACDDLVEASFLLIDKKISALLQIVAANEKIYSLISRVCNGFDLMQTLEMYRVESPDGTSYLAIPDDKERCVGMIFRLLLLLDNEGKNNNMLQNFLERYYSEKESKRAFVEFGSVVRDFKSCVVWLINHAK